MDWMWFGLIALGLALVCLVVLAVRRKSGNRSQSAKLLAQLSLAQAELRRLESTKDTPQSKAAYESARERAARLRHDLDLLSSKWDPFGDSA